MSALESTFRSESPREFFAENPEEKIVVGIDLDECCFDYLGGFRKYLENQGYTIPIEKPNSWNLRESGWVTGESEFVEKHEEAVADGLYSRLELLPHTRETLWDLARSGYEVNVITSRFVVNHQHLLVVQQTAESIEKNDLPYSNLMFQKNKYRFVADAYVDDGPHNIVALKEHDRYVIKINQPYNSHLVVPSADDWLEARELLRERFGR